MNYIPLYKLIYITLSLSKEEQNLSIEESIIKSKKSKRATNNFCDLGRNICMTLTPCQCYLPDKMTLIYWWMSKGWFSNGLSQNQTRKACNSPVEEPQTALYQTAPNSTLRSQSRSSMRSIKRKGTTP